MRTKEIFNPNGDDKLIDRRIIKGNCTNIMNFNDVKYRWAEKIWETMKGNHWYESDVDLTGEDKSYKKLTDDERFAYDGVIGYLIFLDSINSINPMDIANFITAPEVAILYPIQVKEEAIHAKSYGKILEAVIPYEKRQDVYEFWRKNPQLYSRIQKIAKHFQNFRDNPTDENFARALIAMYLLESLYFYNGFTFFYLLQSRNLMPKTADMIRHINQDEIVHVTIAANVIKEINKEFPGFISETMVYEMFDEAVQAELDWSLYIIGDKIIGMNKTSITEYTYYLANRRLRQAGYTPKYDAKRNPFKRLEALSGLKDEDGATEEIGVKSNFFTENVTDYSQADIVQGLDELE